MKTRNILTALMISLILSGAAQAMNFKMEAESYIDDIPFNTKAILMTVQVDQAMETNFEIPAESFIEDMTFDTHEIYAQQEAEKAMKVEFSLPEEAFIKDIPFNTSLIAFRARLREVIFSSAS